MRNKNRLYIIAKRIFYGFMSAKNFYNFVIRHNDIHKRIYISNPSLIITNEPNNDAP